jgi:hypothetical protein
MGIQLRIGYADGKCHRSHNILKTKQCLGQTQQAHSCVAIPPLLLPSGPCPGSSKRDKQDCLLWTARADVAEGEEVCNRYTDYLLQDRSLLQYGFLQVGEPHQWLSYLGQRRGWVIVIIIVWIRL